MSEPHVRVGNVPIVHSVTPGGWSWTTCGIMHTTGPHVFLFMREAVPTDDLVDCMACLVQETRGPAETIHYTISLPEPVRVITLVVDLVPESKK